MLCFDSYVRDLIMSIYTITYDLIRPNWISILIWCWPRLQLGMIVYVEILSFHYVSHENMRYVTIWCEDVTISVTIMSKKYTIIATNRIRPVIYTTRVAVSLIDRMIYQHIAVLVFDKNKPSVKKNLFIREYNFIFT